MNRESKINPNPSKTVTRWTLYRRKDWGIFGIQRRETLGFEIRNLTPTAPFSNAKRTKLGFSKKFVTGRPIGFGENSFLSRTNRKHEPINAVLSHWRGTLGPILEDS